jgi:16S rRNA (cytosine1402-N4)-methyltransferase
MTTITPTCHIPVLLNEVVENAQPAAGKVFVDGTFGGGGYSVGLLEAGAELVIGIDRDPMAIERAAHLQEKYGKRLKLVLGTFSDMAEIIKKEGYEYVDGIVLDLGFSSDQLDDSERGFAFKHDGPLDMRMSDVGETAADVVNTYEEKELADIFWRYGDEKKSRQIAKKIIEVREETPLATTNELVDLVKKIIPEWTVKKNPAMRVFQALRIHVNRELEELEKVLPIATALLEKEGRLCVVTFHSLEERMTKRYFKEVGPIKSINKYANPDRVKKTESPKYIQVHRKSIEPTGEELARNNRARSAKLRVLERTG